MKLLVLIIALAPFWSLSQITQTPVLGKKLGTITPVNGQVDWAPSMKKRHFPSPDGEDYRSELLRRKAEMKRRFPRKSNIDERGGGVWATDSLPRTYKMFEGNDAGNGTPNDNNLAISNSGYLVSVVNSNIYFFDTNADTLMYDASLGLWTIDLFLTNNKFDPKAIYDPINDRFVVVFLHGTGASSSQYIVCFSTSDNPMDPWHMYALDGNPFDDNSWSDYPALSMNHEDLFLTINLLTPGQSWQLGFKESIIWQINKQSGYDGDTTLTSMIWSGISDNGTNIRNLHPVRNARGQFDHQNYNYFLSNKNFALESDTIYLVKITGGLTSSTPSITIDRLHSDVNYYLTVDAPEPGGQELATNDSRILGAVHEKNMIQFVQNSIDTSNGNSAIYHGFIDIQNMTVTGNVISDTGLNLGYPNIAAVSNLPGDQETMITFEFTSPTVFPGYAAVYYDGVGAYSPIKVLKEGENKISVFNDPLERWGDYSGIQRRYNEPCKVWACGTYGKANTDNGTWIAEIGTDSTCSALPVGIENKIGKSIKVFPNPAKNFTHFDFQSEINENISIALYDINGKLIESLMNTEVSKGQYRFTFNTAHLSNGLYLVTFKGSNGTFETKRLVIQ